MDSIIFQSVTRIAEAIRNRQVSSLEILQAYLAQIDRANGALNAVVTLDEEQALMQAKQADTALARGEIYGALHGVPFTLKDCHSTVGMRTTAGYPPLADHIPDYDGTVAKRLKEAGGILVGKTNVSTMLADIQSNNPIFGRTNNPWNLERTAGGSSGGAAAAIASGMTPFDIGSDIGGSIRLPAAFCGIFGLKPTERRVSLYGHIPDLPDQARSVRVMATIGPMARTIDDLALLFGIIAGYDCYDTDVQPVPVDQMPELALSDLRIAIAPTFADFPVSDEIAKAIENLTAMLSPLCYRVEVASLPELDYDRDALSLPGGMAISANDNPNLTLGKFQQVLHRRDQFIVAWEQFFDEWDALICPATMTTAFQHHEPETPFMVDGETHRYWMMNAHCKLFNYTGHPAIVLPLDRDSEGLPIAVQLVGKRWQESRLLGIAKSLTEITGQFVAPPQYRV